MKRIALYVGLGTLTFVLGATTATVWKFRKSQSQAPAVSKPVVEADWPLTKEIVSRSLQSHSFRSNRLRKNSNDEIVWRWLKESIAAYPQNWVKLNISDSESYAVVLDPPQVLEPTELNYLNTELSKKGLTSLVKGKRYLPVNVYQGNLICPSWSGFIDMEEAKLVYFVGLSG